METVVLNAVSKRFRHRPAWFSFARERSGVTVAVNGVSLRASAGDVLVLVGPNGSGKTTLLRLMVTMLLPDSGSVVICGNDTGKQAKAVRRQVGFCMANERTFYPRLTGWENLELFASLEEIPRRERARRIDSVLAQVGLASAATTLAMKYSSGMVQRLGIARALLKQPPVLLLDEPTRSLDVESTAEVWDLIRRAAGDGATVVLATHNFEEGAAVGTRLAVLRNGVLLHSEVISRSSSVTHLRELYARAVESEPLLEARTP